MYYHSVHFWNGIKCSVSTTIAGLLTWLVCVALLLIPGSGSVSRAETIVVNSLDVMFNNSPTGYRDKDSTDGVCADFSGDCNLLAAIEHAGYMPGSDLIVFSVSGTISNNGFTITRGDLVIDGSGANIVLDGVGSRDIFLVNKTGGCVFKGLTFTHASSSTGGRGIALSDAPNNVIGGTTPQERNVFVDNSVAIWIYGSDSRNNVVIGNYIGVDATGSTANANRLGITISLNATNNRIGGTTAAERNVISGNTTSGISLSADSNTVTGNFIGVDATGSFAIPNNIGIDVASYANNRIGGPTAGERNVISGNAEYGLNIFDARSTTVMGNYIGTNSAGSSAIANPYGIRLIVGQDNTIGGASSGEGNLVSGNSQFGMYLSGDSIKVEGNKIGTDATGTSPLGNDSVGIYLHRGSTYNMIGGNSSQAGNVVAYNSIGLQIASNTGNDISRANTIRHNSFHDNLGPGILFTGAEAQDDITSPVITDATTDEISGTSVAWATIDVFIADGAIMDSAEGKAHLASGTSDGTGAFTISLSGATAGDFLTATATDTLGNTSEFAVSALADATTDVGSDEAVLPVQYDLAQNYPNPFNPVTVISFTLPMASDVRLEIYNVAGQKVVTLVDGYFGTDTHSAVWDASGFTSGVYLYRVTAGEFVASRKMLLLK